ncbi:MAG: CHASE2 domain-containing protein, partial [Rhizomicrobium sp.]
MNLRDRPLAIWAFPLVMLVAALLFLGSDVGGMATRLRETLFDAYQRFQPRPYQDTLPRAGFSVRVLDSDTANLKRLGPWPWPHSTLAKLTRELKAKGAALVVFAFPLDVPDPLSPKNLLAQAPFGPAGDPIR